MHIPILFDTCVVDGRSLVMTRTWTAFVTVVYSHYSWKTVYDPVSTVLSHSENILDSRVCLEIMYRSYLSASPCSVL